MPDFAKVAPYVIMVVLLLVLVAVVGVFAWNQRQQQKEEEEGLKQLEEGVYRIRIGDRVLSRVSNTMGFEWRRPQEGEGDRSVFDTFRIVKVPGSNNVMLDIGAGWDSWVRISAGGGVARVNGTPEVMSAKSEHRYSVEKCDGGFILTNERHGTGIIPLDSADISRAVSGPPVCFSMTKI